MNAVIRIGSRESTLAIWQAEKVQGMLAAIGIESKIVRIKAKGDLVLDKPLYELGVIGVFTKALDAALLRGEIDLAVHSMKDVPTLLPEGVAEFAVLKRGDVEDILVRQDASSTVIATGSLRRKAQWLHRHPEYEVVGLRGNVVKRMEKVMASAWHGAVFAKAGLARIGMLPADYEELDWMVPAPAQGALMIVGTKENETLAAKVSGLNHAPTHLEVSIERAFLRELEGGCTAPIGALARAVGSEVKFVGVLNSLDGKKEIRVERVAEDARPEQGAVWARELLREGGEELMLELKNQLQDGKS
jgi:hydroxymethylbilane synthase